MNRAAVSSEPSSRRALPLRRGGAYGAAAMVLASLLACSPKEDALERVRTTGVLKIAALNHAPYCHRGPDGITGYECDLLQGFAKNLGVRLEVKFFDSVPLIIEAVRNGEVEIGAGGLPPTPAYRRFVRFGPPVRSITQQLVYNSDEPTPRDFADLHGDLVVAADSSAGRQLQQLRVRYPTLKWDESHEDDIDALLAQVASDDLDYTVASSDIVTLARQHYPQLRAAFDLAEPEEQVWALPAQNGDGLVAALQTYLQSSGPVEMKRLEDRYFGHSGTLDYMDVARFVIDVRHRLPTYRHLFEAAALRYQLDWRLLAAIGYQESHWDNEAVSPTGVRGLMMLTVSTAAMLQIEDRGDAAQSISGAARYFRDLRDSVPESVPNPDRNWMALAAYNLGLGHLLDARDLTRLRGGDPDRWLDVRKTLPLLARTSWNSKTQFGYARGGEAAIFVSNVRGYYDILAWLTANDTQQAVIATEAAASGLPTRTAQRRP